MPVSTIIAQKRGTLAMALAIEGIDSLLTFGGAGWTFPAPYDSIDYTELRCLSKRGLEWGSDTNPKTLDVSQPSITFRLHDGRLRTYSEDHAITGLLRGLGGVTWTYLAATLDEGDIAFAEVEDATDFPASGTFWLNQEAIGYDSKNTGVTPHRLVDLTRAKYGSVDVTHEVIAADDEAMTEGFLIPRVKSAPTSWYGRRCILWQARVRHDGTLEEAEIAWLGRFKGDLKCVGAYWEVPAESLVDALHTKILTNQPTTTLRGVAISTNESITWESADTTGTSTIVATDGPWSTVQDFLDYMTETLIADMTGAGEGRWPVFAVNHDGRHTFTAWIRNGGFVGAHDLTLQFGSQLSAVLGFDTITLIRLTTDEAGPHLLGPEFVAAIAMDTTRSVLAKVQSANRFTVFETLGPTWTATSIVSIGGLWFYLRDSNATDDTLRVQLIEDLAVNATEEVAAHYGHGVDVSALYLAVREVYGLAPSYIREGVLLRGFLFEMWRDGFIDNDDVPSEWKRGIRSSDFDWDNLALQRTGGESERRQHVLGKPESFRDLFFGDMRWSMIAPAIRYGKVGGIRMVPPTSLDANFTFDRSIKARGKPAEFTRSSQRVQNQVTYSMPGLGAEATAIVNERDSQVEYDDVFPLELQCAGVAFVPREIVDALAAQAWSYMSIFAWDNPEVGEIANIGAAGVQPGDVNLVTDERLPNPDTGKRGVTNAVMLVLGHRVKPYNDGVHVTLKYIWVTDAVRRSGYAPSARIDSYVDNGAPAGDQRHELVIDPGFYSGVNEATFYDADYRVELRARDDGTPTVESRIVSPAGNNGASVFITAAPSAGMQAVIAAGKGLIELDDFNTAGAVAAQLQYVFVCDEDDDLIQDSEDGYQPA